MVHHVHKPVGINHTTAMMIIALMAVTVQKANISMTASAWTDMNVHVSSAVTNMNQDQESDVIATNASVSMVDGCALRTNVMVSAQL